MEAKGRKMLALGVVAMMCAVAIIGVGYAAFSNTATARTYNEGNSATAGYMKITPGSDASGDWSAISVSANNASFETYVYKTGTYTAAEAAEITAGTDLFYATSGDGPFKAATPAQITAGTNLYHLTSAQTKTAYYNDGTLVETVGSPANGYVVKALGVAKSFYIENMTGDSISTVTFGAKADAAAGNSDFKYFLKVTANAVDYYLPVNNASEETVDISLGTVANEGNTTITVAICIGYEANCYIPDSFIGDVAASSTSGYTQAAIGAPTSEPADMTNVSFAFSIKLPSA